MSLLATLGILSALTNLIGLVPYILDIFKGKTKPERATWWIWSSLSGIALAAQIAAGATWSLLMTVAQFISVVGIALLSIKFGYGKLEKRDKLSFVWAALGIVLWVITDRPLLALLIVIAVDLIALWLTLVKTWKSPETETLIAWVLATLSGLFGLLAVGNFELDHYIYPLYIMIGNGSIVLTIIYRRSLRTTSRH